MIDQRQKKTTVLAYQAKNVKQHTRQTDRHVADRFSGSRLGEVERLSRAEASPAAGRRTSLLGLGFWYPCRTCCQLHSLEQTM